MSKNMSLRVYADEDTDLGAKGFMSELDYEIVDVTGVLTAEIEKVFDSRPFEAIVEIEYDETVTNEEQLRMNVASFAFVHNAQS